MKNINSVSVSMLAGLLWLPGLTSAQTAPASTNRPPAHVRLPEVVVRGTNAPVALSAPGPEQARQEIRQTPGGVDLIDAESYKTGRTSTLKDVLDYSPGVFTQPRFGSDEARISIRGSGLQRTFHGRGLELLQDGVPLNLGDGAFDMQSVEPFATRYVEVYRGGNALRYGSSTLGGAINYVSPTGYDAPRIDLRTEGGSYGYFRGYAASGLVSGRTDYYASISELKLDGYRNHSQQNNQRIFSNLGYRLGDSAETRFYFTYVRTASELPGNLTKAQLESNPTLANPGNIGINQQRNYELLRAANKTTWLAELTEVELSTWYSHKDLHHPITPYLDQNSNDFGANLQYRNKADWLNRHNELTFGIMPTVGVLEESRYTNIAGHPGPLIGQSTQNSYNANFYGEDRHWLADQWSLIGGGQFTYSVRDYQNTFGGLPPNFEYSYWGFNPKVGAIYEPQPGVQIYGNVSRSFEPPTFSELGVISGVLAARDAQSAWTTELGTRGEIGRFTWDATYYRAWVDNELLSYETSPNVFATINASTTVHQGVELGGTFTLWEGLITSPDGQKNGDRLLFRQAYQWNDFHFQDDRAFGNNRLPGIPEHYLRAELTYEHPSGFYFGPNAEWSAVKYPVDMANTLFADPYALLGFKVGYRVKKGLSAFFEARNLTDKRYAATTGVITRPTVANQAQFLPGDGRSFYAGLEWRW